MSGNRLPPSYPWEGTEYCTGTSRDGSRCQVLEIEGMEFCFRHVPEELIEEAEAVTGMRRCRQPVRGTLKAGTIIHCRNVATTGTEPPRCGDHGANVGGVQSKQAAKRVVNAAADTRLGEVMSEHGERLMRSIAVENPLAELLDLAGEVREFKEILREIVAK